MRVLLGSKRMSPRSPVPIPQPTGALKVIGTTEAPSGGRPAHTLTHTCSKEHFQVSVIKTIGDHGSKEGKRFSLCGPKT